MNFYRVRLLGIGVGLMLAGCSQQPAQTAATETTTTTTTTSAPIDPGPDNSFTRYGENLARSEQRARDVANRANAAIAREEGQLNHMQQQQQPQQQDQGQ